MSLDKKLAREKAKKVYKEEIKKLPKRQRPTFAMFLKQYEQKLQNDKVFNPPPKEDFNFEQMVNVNEGEK